MIKMIEHPYPKGTRVVLDHNSAYSVYKVLKYHIGPEERRDQGYFYYTLVAEEWWDSEGIEVKIDLLGLSVRSFHGAGQYDNNISLCSDDVPIQERTDAIYIYEKLRRIDP